MTDLFTTILIIVCALCALGGLLVALSDLKAQRRAQKMLAAARQEQSELSRQLSQLSGALSQMQANTNHASSAQEERFERMRQSVELQNRFMAQSNEQTLDKMQKSMEAQLSQIRQTVDEKLQNTLDKRLGESFAAINERLEAVYKGLGEMQSLATGVGDLKNILTNVKTRGVWGEVQLDAILSQMLAPHQYQKSVQVEENSRERVDFAVRMPGRESEGVLLPIDAKFPLEDYQRLVKAAEEGDREALTSASAALQNAIRQQAKSIAAKYIRPPKTTDFALMFLPTEGLYAEALRLPGLSEALQRDYRIILVGPTTVCAILSSLQTGFRTVAIEQRAGQVWKLLGAVKAEFSKFSDILAKTQRNLQLAANTIDDAARKTRTIERHLRTVEEVDAGERLFLSVPED